MSEPNLYWPVYKNLEREFLKLAEYVHISDDQMEIYSMHIADLIVRCSIEIEALAKQLYSRLGGNMSPVDVDGNIRDLYFDTDCLELLEQKWKISKKKIAVSAVNIFLTDVGNTIITPLNKSNRRGTSGSKWKQAYQAIKHDRHKCIKRATLKNLLHALGALYILNLFYKNERTDIGRVYLSDYSFDNRAGSDLFSAFTYSATSLSMSNHMDDSCINPSLNEKIDDAIFIIKYENKSFEEMHKCFCLDEKETKRRFNNNSKISQFLIEHPEYKDKSINEICMEAGGINLLMQIICFDHTIQEKNLRMEAVINKNNSIYPELFPLF